MKYYIFTSLSCLFVLSSCTSSPSKASCPYLKEHPNATTQSLSPEDAAKARQIKLHPEV